MEIVFLLVAEGSFLHPPPNYQRRRLRWIQIPAGFRLPNTVTEVINFLDRDETIEVLKILGHGDSGPLFLGEDLTVNNIHHFARLKPHFALGGNIELHGCGVASDRKISQDGRCYQLGTYGAKGPGYLMMRELARVTNTCVVAGIDCQVND